MNHSVSFIVPALNESLHIRGAIASINKYSAHLDEYEILVIDNGSNDDTVGIAENIGATVYCKPGLSLGALRNFGASIARYDYLVFLDADVYLTPMWQERILKVIERLTENELVIAGSTYGIPANPSLIEACWWGQATGREKVNYINSGHMIVRRQVFNKLGGFDVNLKTGEDSEFCQRERREPVDIVHDPDLFVIHEGYPKTWRQFFKRERWHGLGDYNSLSIFKRSKPALVSIAQAVLSVAAFILSVATGNFCWLLLYPTIILPVCILAAYKRSHAINRCLVVNAGLFLTYFWARAIALMDVQLERNCSRKP